MTAKEYLLRYKTAYREAQDVELRLTQLRLKYSLPSGIDYDGMPKSHGNIHDLSDYAVKREAIENQLIAKYSMCMGIEGDILERLDQMTDQTEREILRMRYVDGMRWQDIADHLHYTYRSVTRIHGTALQHFPLPEDVL